MPSYWTRLDALAVINMIQPREFRKWRLITESLIFHGVSSENVATSTGRGTYRGTWDRNRWKESFLPLCPLGGFSHGTKTSTGFIQSIVTQRVQMVFKNLTT
ncbi:hypothetical protein CEXT_512761 [Caerostris extrusa]|uniref:Uncharacterized protein n=1 Tax=Caerostris extrusa TaxID=172846 RepID=A0AAV4MRR7_CAEEX|nr:hypothetical protein CEXT_512761 [Caerostris extrusa]